MNFSKRFVAFMLACIMALSMLTACGGGGGGGGGSASALKLSNTPLVTGEVTLEGIVTMGSDSGTANFASDGKDTYVREIENGFDDVVLKKDSNIYMIDLTSSEKTAVDVSSSAGVKARMELYETILNVKDHISDVKTGKTTVYGIEYNSESIAYNISGDEGYIAYCFEGNTLKYIAVLDSSSTVEMTIQVTTIKNGVDSSLLTVDGWIKNAPAPSKTITISVLAASSGGTVSGSGTYTVGASVTVKATPNTGYTFASWQDNGTTVSTSENYTFTASESVTLTAVFEKTGKPAVSDGIPVDEEHFPDAKFRSFVSTYIDKDSNGYLSEAECDAVVNMDNSCEEIASLKGIEYFTKLQSLDCGFNSLTSLDLSSNTELTSLVCDDNQLTSLNVSQNTKLESLSCSDNSLTNLDVSHNTALESLACTNNKLTNLDISHNANLRTLRCEQNQLTNLNLLNNTKLDWLFCDDNLLASLDVSQNTELENLYCSKNQLMSLDISANPSLIWLNCSDNQLTSLDLSNNTKLEYLVCEGNNLTVLDISDCLGVLPRGSNLIVEESVTLILGKSVNVAANNNNYGTVALESDGVITNVDDKETMYRKGSNITVTATPKEGYDFRGWRLADGTVVSTSASYTFTVKEDMELYAIFEESNLKEYDSSFYVLKNFSTQYCYSQKSYDVNSDMYSKGCVATADAIAYSMTYGVSADPLASWDYEVRGQKYCPIAQTSAKTPQQQRQQIYYNLINGFGTVVRVKSGSGSSAAYHSVAAVGFKKDADKDNLKSSDILVVDPAGGGVKTLDKVYAGTARAELMTLTDGSFLRIPNGLV